MPNSKTILSAGVLAIALHSLPLQAAEVVGHSPDNTSGHMLGGWAGVLVGGAAGGPLGALAVGLGGAWIGGEVQQASGQSGQLHHIRIADGDTVTLRSPRRTFATGEDVRIARGRLRAMPDTTQ